jgi:hypothetical protein
VGQNSRVLRTCLAALTLAACAHATEPLANHGAARPGGELRALDWQNRAYELDELGTVTVHAGHADFAISDDNKAVAIGSGSGSFTVEPPLFADLDGDGHDDAILSCVLSTGGTGHFSEIRIYGLRAHQPTLIATIPGGDRGDGGIRHVALDGTTVLVDRNVLAEGDGLCCASQARRERWTWKTSELVEDESARKPIQP